MENIIQPNDMVNFDFSNISLKTPKPIQGGSFLSSIKNNNDALIIQTPKIKTKKGRVGVFPINEENWIDVGSG